MKKLSIVNCLNITKEMIEKMQTKIPQIDYQLPELSVQPKGNYSQYINN